MAVIGTFGSFTTARLALYASQGSLNVTGNNIANINTKGYTRQRMDLVSLNATGQAKYANSFMVDVGYGVLCDRTSQLRDPFLDIRYRDKNSQLGEVERWQAGLDELSSVLDEVARGEEDFGIVEKQLNDFLTQLQNLLGRVGNEEYDDLVRSSASTLCKLFNTAYDDVDKIREDRVGLLEEQVNKANGLLTEIRDLNKQIREHSIYGDSALELRDARNLALDELSSLMHINVEYSMERLDQYTEVEKLTVTLADSADANGQPIKLVDGVYGTQLQMPERVPAMNPNYPKSGGMYLKNDLTTTNDLEVEKKNPDGTTVLGPDGKPVMEPNPDLLMVDSFKDGSSNNQYLFQLDSLKDENGRLYRDKNGKEIDTQTTQKYIGDTVITGGLQAIRELLTEEGVYASKEDIAMDPEATTKRGIPYYLSALNSFAQKFAEVMNEANQLPAGQVYKMNDAGDRFVDKDGNVIKVTLDDGTEHEITLADVQKEVTGKDPVPYGDKDAESKFAAKCLEALRKSGVLVADYDYYDGGVLFSNRDDNNDPTGITAKNISVSMGWQDGVVRILNTKNPNKDLNHSTDEDNIQHIISIFEKEHEFIPTAVQGDAASGEPFFKGPFQHFFTDIAGTLAADAQISNAKYINYSTEALDLENSRQSVSGVDLNDEATSMIQFSKAYSAACRLMTTLDSMLDKLINGTAI